MYLAPKSDLLFRYTAAAVGFAGLLAVILSGGDVQGMLTDLIKGALTLG